MGPRLYVTLLILLLPPLTLASGHGPLFGLATPTNSQGEWSFDFATALRNANTGTSGMMRGMVTYGFTPHLQLSASAPISLGSAAMTPSRTMMGDFETSLGWRFHRQALGVGARFESTLFAGIVMPSAGDDGPMGMLARAPGGQISLASGIASRSHYLWAGGGYTRYAERSNDRRPELFNYSLVWGYRPPALRTDFPHADWRIFIEATGERWSRARHNGLMMPGTQGHQVMVGPSTLGIFKSFAVETGIQFPLYREVGHNMPRERFRAAVNVSYFLFRFKGDH